MVTATPNAVTKRGRNMQNVVGYVRVFTQGQARDGYSLLSSHSGWADKDVTFLKSLTFLRGVEVYADAGYAGGYAGQGQNLNKIRIVTEANSNKIIISYPSGGPTFKP
jgi:hypothetical protein